MSSKWNFLESINFLSFVESESIDKEINCTFLFANSDFIEFSSGISAIHGTHQVAQIFIHVSLSEFRTSFAKAELFKVSTFSDLRLFVVLPKCTEPILKPTNCNITISNVSNSNAIPKIFKNFLIIFRRLFLWYCRQLSNIRNKLIQ